MKVILPLLVIVCTGAVMHLPLLAMETQTNETELESLLGAKEVRKDSTSTVVYQCQVGEPLSQDLLPAQSDMSCAQSCTWWQKEGWFNLDVPLKDLTPDSQAAPKKGYDIGPIKGLMKDKKGWTTSGPKATVTRQKSGHAGRQLVWFVRNRPLAATINYLQALEVFRLHYTGCQDVPGIRGLVMYWHQWPCTGGPADFSCYVRDGYIESFPVLLLCDGCNGLTRCGAIRAAQTLEKEGFAGKVYAFGCRGYATNQTLHHSQLKAVLHSFYCILELPYNQSLAIIGDDLLGLLPPDFGGCCCSVL